MFRRQGKNNKKHLIFIKLKIHNFQKNDFIDSFEQLIYQSYPQYLFVQLQVYFFYIGIPTGKTIGESATTCY